MTVLSGIIFTGKIAVGSPVTTPGAPTSVVATSGDTTATVSFLAPLNNGGSAITGYTVTSIPAGGVDTNAGTTALSHTITGLTNGTSYTFTVTATNASGTGPASAASNSVTPSLPPYAGTLTTVTMPSSGQWGACPMVTDGERLVAFREASTVCAVTTDGVNWTQGTMPGAAISIRGAVYAQGAFWAVGSGSNRMLTSTDGLNWSTITLPSSLAWYTLAYGNGTFVVGTFSDYPYLTSTDGTTWTSRTLTPDLSAPNAIAYGAGVWAFASRANGARVVTTTDFATRTNRTVSPSATSGSMIFVDNKFVTAPASTRSTISSTNGTTWTTNVDSFPTAGAYYGLTHGNGKFLAIRNTSNGAVAVSSDGTTWADGPVLPLTVTRACTYFKGKFYVGVNANSTTMYVIS